MAQAKHTSIRLKPNVRALADQLCALEHRDLTNLIEISLISYGRQRGIEVPDAGEEKGKQG
jgi:hypothetical protein